MPPLIPVGDCPLRRVPILTLLAIVFLGAPSLATADDRAVETGKTLLKGRTLAERRRGVETLIKADAPGSVQPLEELIRANAAEIDRLAKPMDDLELLYSDARYYYEDAQARNDERDIRTTAKALAEAQAAWRRQATELSELLALSVEAGEGFASLSSPGAVARLAAGAKSESDPWIRQCCVRGLGRKGRESSLPVLFELAAGPNPLHRAMAVRALLPFVLEPAVFDTLKTLAVDRAWMVRAGAYLAIARAPFDYAVPVLVEAALRERGELALGVDALLSSLTGVGYPADPRLWGPWWKEHEREVRDGTWRAPESKPADPDARSTRAKFFRIPIDSTNVVFAIDYSGSMTEELKLDDAPADEVRAEFGLAATRLGYAQAELIRAVRDLPNDAVFNIVAYSDKATAFASRPQPATESTKRSAVSWITKNKTGWLTNIWEALRQSFVDPLARGTTGRTLDIPDTIVFLTDGAPSRGRFQDDESLEALVRTWNASIGAVVHCVAIGEDADGTLLKTIADATHGFYVDLSGGVETLVRRREGVPAGERVPALSKRMREATFQLENGSVEERVAAVKETFSFRTFRPEALGTVVALFGDTDAPVRDAAAAALRSMGAPAAAILAPVLSSDTANVTAVDTVLDVLAALGHDAVAAVPAVTALIEHNDPLHRTAAAKVLGAVGPAAKAAIPALKAALEAASDEEKAAFSDALKAIQK